MIIIIAGNIASGKSTLANYIANTHNLHIIGIDKYRNKYQDEFQSRQAMLQDIKLYPSFVYETTTANQAHPLFMDEIRKKGTPIFTILVICRQETCLERYKSRPYDRNTLHHLDIQKSINRIDQCLRDVLADFVYPSEVSTPQDFYHHFNQKLNGRPIFYNDYG
jgi:adenylate kinase family enzyme